MATCGVLILALGATPALAESSDSDAFDALEAIQVVAPVDATGVAGAVDSEEGLVADAAGLAVTVPTDGADGIQLGVEGAPIIIGLPFAQKAADAQDSQIPGVVVYDNRNGSSTVPIVRDDGSVQITTVIDNASAPKRYDYPMTLPAGLTLKLDETGAVSAGGSEPSIPAVYVAPPWATDAEGNAVPTHYEVTGSTVTQVVDFAADATFPIVADPATYVDYTTSSVINVVRLGASTKWKYLNACTAAKGKSCSVSRSYEVSSSSQTALSVSYATIAGSTGVTNGQSVTYSATCGINSGPGTATLYAQANKTTYQARTVRHWGVPNAGGGSMHTETKTSGTLAAYKPNGKFTCV